MKGASILRSGIIFFVIKLTMRDWSYDKSKLQLNKVYKDWKSYKDVECDVLINFRSRGVL